MSSRRSALDDYDIQKSTNSGLWLDKFFPGGDGEKKSEHIKKIHQEIMIPEGYADAFRHRRDALENTPRPAGVQFISADVEVAGRMIVGLGQKSVLEMGISLDHTWGVPYLPGSSLKGIAAWTARHCDHESWKNPKGENFLALFGGPDTAEQDEVGCIRFLDAWLKPSNKKIPIHLDVMTVHHQDYYQKNDDTITPPSDMDSPVPISFASVNGTFELLIEGPEKWAEAALQLLSLGLKEHGIGAKTAGGYGRMTVLPRTIAETDAQIRYRNFHKEIDFRIQNLKKGNADQNVPRILADCRRDASDSLNEIKRRIVEKLTQPWIKTRTQPWAQDLLIN